MTGAMIQALGWRAVIARSPDVRCPKGRLATGPSRIPGRL